MRIQDWTKLSLLAAIWGFSFIFMRVLAPVLGAFWTADLRVLLAGVALVVWCLLTGHAMQWKRWWRDYLVIGLLNSGIPFLLYAFAALQVPAGYLAIINAGTPLFGAVFGALWLGDALTARKVFGLFLGICGVAVISGIGALHSATPTFAISALSGVLATVCYGLSGVYIKRRMAGAPVIAMAGCSQLLSGLVLLPAALVWGKLPQVWPTGMTLVWLIVSLLALALLCSSVAYVLYYRLMTDVGPTKAMTVTYLVPAFSVLWGVIFLSEPLTWVMLLGGVLILGATLLVVRQPVKG